MKTNRSTLLSAIVVAFLGWQWGQAGWIMAKAELAQWLIADAWQQSLNTGGSDDLENKPWQWADTWPVARLQAPERGIDLYILEGDTGNALAFGPGRNKSSRAVGNGTSVIGGHRDTHFRFLKEIDIDEPLRVQTRSGQWLNYIVERQQVVDIHKNPLTAELDKQQLILVTCYPFDTLNSNGPLRLVVTAALIEPTKSETKTAEFQLVSQHTESSPAIAF